MSSAGFAESDEKIMQKALIGLMLILGLVGCDKREKPQGSNSSKPLLDQEEARRIVRDLPEVVKWSRQVRERSGGRVVPVYQAECTPGDCKAAGRPPVWIFYLGESHKTHRVLWQRFQIDAVSGDVSVWDPFKGNYVPIETWRNRFRPP